MTPEILIRLAGVGEFVLMLVFKAFAAYMVYEGVLAMTMSSKVAFYFGAALFTILVIISMEKKKDAGIAAISEMFSNMNFDAEGDEDE